MDRKGYCLSFGFPVLEMGKAMNLEEIRHRPIERCVLTEE